MKLEAYRQGVSLSELKRRQKLEEIGGKLLSCAPSQTPDTSSTRHDKESDFFIPTATTDRSSTVGRALCHALDASNICYLVGHVTPSVLPGLKKQRREQNFIVCDAVYHSKQPSLRLGHIQLQTCQCHVNTSVPKMGHMSQSTCWAKRTQTHDMCQSLGFLQTCSMRSPIAHATLHCNSDSIKVNAVLICAVPACATPVLCDRIENETNIRKASISLVSRHTNGMSGFSGFAANVVTAREMPVLRDRIRKDMSILLVMHCMVRDSAGFAAEVVPACESEMPALCDGNGKEASFSLVTWRNPTNGTSDSA